jgi:HAMP domain-containing protein
MLKRLKIWQKFTLIAVAFSIPIVVLTYFLILEHGKQIAFTSAELDGTDYLRPLRKLVIDVSAHRDLASAVLAGDASVKPELEAKGEEIEADFKALEAVNAKHEWQFGKGALLAEVRQNWQNLRSNLAGAKLDQSFDEHTRFIRMLLQFSYHIGNASNLILDPQVDSYYAIDAMITKIPKVTEEISRARAIGAAYIASGGTGEENSNRRGALAEAVVRIEDALQQQNDFIRFARNFNPQTEEALAGVIAENTKAVNGFATLLAERVVNATGEQMTLKEFLAAAAVPLAQSGKLWDVTAVELERLLGLRLGGLNRNRTTEIAAVIVALALTILFLGVVVRAITRPIAHLREVADRISLGDMEATIDVDTKDEIGELGESFRRLQVSLKEAMDALERQDDVG